MGRIRKQRTNKASSRHIPPCCAGRIALGTNYRRLTGEALEDRRMLGGVTLITHGFLPYLEPNLPAWVAEMSNAVADRVAERNNGDREDVAHFRMEVTRVIPGLPGLHVSDWDFHGDFVGQGDPTVYDLRGSLGGEAVISLDWSAIAGLDVFPTGLKLEQSTRDVAEAVADYLVNDLGDLGSQLLASPIHLIGHSRGASLIGALAEDLGEAGLWIEHTTYLDAHPVWPIDWGEFDLGVTGRAIAP